MRDECIKKIVKCMKAEGITLQSAM
jgi:hypothetical protein